MPLWPERNEGIASAVVALIAPGWTVLSHTIPRMKLRVSVAAGSSSEAINLPSPAGRIKSPPPAKGRS